jgi:predicted DNA-binding transcriptional regulator AlpA
MATRKQHHQDNLPNYYVDLIAQVRNASRINTIKIKPAALKVGNSVAGIWAAIKLGTFPPPIKVSARSIAFIEAELDALLAAKREMSRTGQNIDLQVFISLLIAPRQSDMATLNIDASAPSRSKE